MPFREAFRSAPALQHAPTQDHISNQAKKLSRILRTTVRPVIGAWTLAPWLPWPYRLVDLAGRAVRPARGASFHQTEVGGIRALEVVPDNVTPERTILYFHGGAFLVGGWQLHRGLISHIAVRTSARIVAVDYRQLPAHPISASVADCATAYRALTAHPSQGRVVLMGDSAGGYLVFSTLAAALRQGLPMPAAAVVMSPLTEARPAEAGQGFGGCAVFGRRAIPALLKYADARETFRGHDTPNDAVGAALPPILFQAAQRESLYPQIERFARRIREAGVACELRAWNTDVHVFQAGVGWLPEADDAITHLARFCEREWVQGDATIAG